MSSADHLRRFVGERLTAAAEEIFGVFHQTIVQYEEEIERQRKLLDVVWKPEIKLHRIELPLQPVCQEEEEVLAEQQQQQLWKQERNSRLHQEVQTTHGPEIKEEQEELCSSQPALKQENQDLLVTHTYEEHDEKLPQQHVCKEEEVLAEQLWNQERNSSVDKEEPEPPQMKEEQEQLCINGRGRGKETLMLTSTYEEKDQSEGQTEFPEEIKFPVLPLWYTAAVSEVNSELSNNSATAESPDQNICKNKDSDPASDTGKELKKKSNGTTDNVNHPGVLRTGSNTGTRCFRCDTCGKEFKQRGNLREHVRIHTGERPYICKTCGKAFAKNYGLMLHIRTHTGEKPYVCKFCGKGFSDSSSLIRHQRLHTGERPYLCNTCGKGFVVRSDLSVHVRRVHTGERSDVGTSAQKDSSTRRAHKGSL